MCHLPANMWPRPPSQGLALWTEALERRQPVELTLKYRRKPSASLPPPDLPADEDKTWRCLSEIKVGVKGQGAMNKQKHA